MTVTTRLAVPLWIAFFAAAGCTRGMRVETVDDAPPDEHRTSRLLDVNLELADPFEAEILSLCVSETLFPLAELSEEILYHLAAIRSAYGNTALVRTRARSAWTGEIEIEFDEAASHEFFVGNYYLWNELNVELGPVRVIPGEFGRARLQFEKLFNPCLASERYLELPGINAAAPVFDATDGPAIFIGFSAWYGYTYLFRYAYDDCEHGCRREEFFYFRFNDDEPVMVGKWDTGDAGPPAWWTEAADQWIDCSCAALASAPPSRSDREPRFKQKN